MGPHYIIQVLYVPVQVHTSKFIYYTTIIILISMLQWGHSQEEVPAALTPSPFYNESTPPLNHTHQHRAVHQSAAEVQV